MLNFVEMKSVQSGERIITVYPARLINLGRMLRDNQGERRATIRMRMAPGVADGGRA